VFDGYKAQLKKRVHWCVVVFDGNKAQLFKDTYTREDAFCKDYSK
jgi:hypothetical protein